MYEGIFEQLAEALDLICEYCGEIMTNRRLHICKKEARKRGKL